MKSQELELRNELPYEPSFGFSAVVYFPDVGRMDSARKTNASRTPEQSVSDQLRIPPWGRLLIKLLVIASVAVLGAFWKLNHDVSVLEGELKNLPQSLATSLVKQAANEASRGSLPEASNALRLGTAAINYAASRKLPAGPDYFKSVVGEVNKLSSVAQARPELSEQAHATLVSLAGYRSVLQPTPKLIGKEKTTTEPVQDLSFLKGWTIRRKITPGDFILPPLVRTLPGASEVEDLALVGGTEGVSQILDGIIWVNVIFVNLHVKYQGGVTVLNNVRFVNCSFDVVNDSDGTEIANYVALQNTRLRIGNNSTGSVRFHTRFSDDIATLEPVGAAKRSCFLGLNIHPWTRPVFVTYRQSVELRLGSITSASITPPPRSNWRVWMRRSSGKELGNREAESSLFCYQAHPFGR